MDYLLGYMLQEIQIFKLNQNRRAFKNRLSIHRENLIMQPYSINHGMH